VNEILVAEFAGAASMATAIANAPETIATRRKL
jgi:hypothetical protein